MTTLEDVHLDYRLELRSYWSFFKFLSISKRAQKQVEQATGNLHAGLNNLGFRFVLPDFDSLGFRRRYVDIYKNRSTYGGYAPVRRVCKIGPINTF